MGGAETTAKITLEGIDKGYSKMIEAARKAAEKFGENIEDSTDSLKGYNKGLVDVRKTMEANSKSFVKSGADLFKWGENAKRSFDKFTDGAEATADLAATLDKGFIKMGASLLGFGKPLSAVNSLLGPLGGAIAEVVEQETAAGKAAAILNQVSRPLINTLKSGADIIDGFAKGLQSMGVFGEFAAEKLFGLSRTMRGMAKAVGIADTAGDIYMMGQAAAAFAKENGPAAIETIKGLAAASESMGLKARFFGDSMKTANTLAQGFIVASNLMGKSQNSLGLNIAQSVLKLGEFNEKMQLIGNLAGLAGSLAVQWGQVNTAMEGIQAMGINTTYAELAMSIGMVGEGLLFNAEAAKKFGIAAVAAYAQLQDRLAYVTTLSSGAAVGQEKMGAAMQELVNGPLKNQITSLEAADALYNTMSAGFADFGQATSVMTAGLKLAAGAGADTSTSMEALIKTTNAFKVPARDAGLAAAKLNGIVENGIISFQQLAGGMPRVSSAASTMGIKMDELGGSLAALTYSMTADTAMTGLESLINSIAGQGAEAEKTLKQYGAVLDVNTIKQKGLVNSLKDVWKAVGGNASAFKDIIPDALAFNTALNLVTTGADRAEEYTKNLANTTEESVDDMFGRRQQSLIKQTTALMNGFQEVIIDFGEKLGPLLQPGIDFLTGVLNGLKSLPEPLKAAIAAMVVAQVGMSNLIGMGQSVMGTMMSLGTSFLMARASSLLFSGQLPNVLKQLYEAVAVNKDYGRAVELVTGLEKKRVTEIKEAEAATKAQAVAQKAIAKVFGTTDGVIHDNIDSYVQLKNQLSTYKQEINAMKPTSAVALPTEEDFAKAEKGIDKAIAALQKLNAANEKALATSKSKSQGALGNLAGYKIDMTPQLEDNRRALESVRTSIDGLAAAQNESDLSMVNSVAAFRKQEEQLLANIKAIRDVELAQERLQAQLSTLPEELGDDVAAYQRATAAVTEYRQAIQKATKGSTIEVKPPVGMLQSIEKQLDETAQLAARKGQLVGQVTARSIQDSLKVQMAAGKSQVTQAGQELVEDIGKGIEKGKGKIKDGLSGLFASLGSALGVDVGLVQDAKNVADGVGEVFKDASAKRTAAAAAEVATTGVSVAADTANVASKTAAAAATENLGRSSVKAAAGVATETGAVVASTGATSLLAKAKLGLGSVMGKVGSAFGAMAAGGAGLMAVLKGLWAAMLPFLSAAAPWIALAGAIAAALAVIQDAIPIFGGFAGEVESLGKKMKETDQSIGDFSEKTKQYSSNVSKFIIPALQETVKWAMRISNPLLWAMEGAVNGMRNSGLDKEIKAKTDTLKKLEAEAATASGSNLERLKKLIAEQKKAIGELQTTRKTNAFAPMQWINDMATNLKENWEAKYNEKVLTFVQEQDDKLWGMIESSRRSKAKTRSGTFASAEAQKIVADLASAGNTSGQDLEKALAADRAAMKERNDTGDAYIAQLEKELETVAKVNPEYAKELQSRIKTAKAEMSADEELMRKREEFVRGQIAMRERMRDNADATGTERTRDRIAEIGSKVFDGLEGEIKQGAQDTFDTFGEAIAQFGNSPAQRKAQISLASSAERVFSPLKSLNDLNNPATMSQIDENVGKYMDGVQSALDANAIDETQAQKLLVNLETALSNVKLKIGGEKGNALSADIQAQIFDIKQKMEKSLADKDNEIQLNFSVAPLKARSNLLDQISKDLELQNSLLSSQSDLIQTAYSYEQGRIQNQLKFTQDVEARAGLEVQAAEKTYESMLARQETDRQTLEIQIQQNRLALEREAIQNRMAEAENKRAIASAQLALAQARAKNVSEKELTLLEQSLASLQQEGDAIQKNGQLTRESQRQQEVAAQNSRQKLEYEQALAAEGGALDVQAAKLNKMTASYQKFQERAGLAAKEVENAANKQLSKQDAIGKQYDRQLSVLNAQKEAMTAQASIADRYLQMGIESIKDESRKADLIRKQAEIKVQTLLRQQEMERQVFEIQQLQNKAALEREKIQLRIQAAQAKADVAGAQAELAKVKATPGATPEQLKAAELSLEAAMEKGAATAFAQAMTEQQGGLQDQLSNASRQTMRQTQELALDEAKMGAAKAGSQQFGSEESLARSFLDKGLQMQGGQAPNIKVGEAPEYDKVREDFMSDMKKMLGEAGGATLDEIDQQRKALEAAAAKPGSLPSAQATIDAMNKQKRDLNSSPRSASPPMPAPASPQPPNSKMPTPPTSVSSAEPPKQGAGKADTEKSPTQGATMQVQVQEIKISIEAKGGESKDFAEKIRTGVLQGLDSVFKEVTKLS